MVIMVDLLVVSIGLMMKSCCFVMLFGNFMKYLCGFKVFLFWYILIKLILVVGINLVILLIIFRLVCKIGMMVIFFLVNFF